VINAETGAGGLLAVREAHTATLLKDTTLLASGRALTPAEFLRLRSCSNSAVAGTTTSARPLSTSPDLLRAATIAKPTTTLRKVGLSPHLPGQKMQNDSYVKTNYALPRIHPAQGVYTLNWLLRRVFAAGVASESHP